MLPTGQIHTVGRTDPLDTFYHLILPATVLAIVNAAPLVRYTRASMLDVAQQRVRHDGPRRRAWRTGS